MPPLTVAYQSFNTQPSPPLTASTAQASDKLFPNTSSINVSNFSYIIPYGQTQDCNIYGPICQTGSITVGVNLTTTATSTILPCSSYLSAQSAYLMDENENIILGNPNTDWGDSVPGWLGGPEDQMFDTPDLADWNTNFGQSPECRSYAKAMKQGRYTFSDCGSSNTVIQTAAGLSSDYPSQLPPGLVQQYDNDYTDTCCGNCSLEIPEVRVYYFPDRTTSCQNNQTSNTTSILSSHHLRKRVHSLVADGDTAIVSGYTLQVKVLIRVSLYADVYCSTSPSIYLQLVGTATVVDQCTTVGPMLTNPIISLAPGGLSTWQPVGHGGNGDLPITVGEIWNDPKGGNLQEFIDMRVGIAPMDVRDLACPTWGLGYSTSDDGTVITTIGPPYLPIIIPPMGVFSLDPKWASGCTAVYTDSTGRTTLAVVDPPMALTPAVMLPPPPTVPPTLAKPTTVGEPALPSTKPAKPSSIPIDPLAPAKTQDPGKGSPTPPPVIISAGPDSLPDNSAGSSDGEDNPPSDTQIDPKPSVSAITGDPPSDPPSDPEAGAGDPAAGSIASLSNANDSPWDDSQQPPIDPKQTVVPSPNQGGNSPQTHTQGLGAIIYNAFGQSGPEVDGSPTPLSPPQSVFTIGTRTFTANPTGFKINNAAITPGGTAHIIDGTTISLGQSGVLAIGTSTISFTSPRSTSLAAEAYTIAGQIFTPNPSGFSIAGTTISANGPAATVGGTIISLAYDGVPRIGSSTISLLSPSDTPSEEVYTVAGQTFTPNPSEFSIAGTTVSAGSPAATINGTLISLQPSGTLVIGSSTISLSIPSQSPSDGTIDGFDVKAHSSFIVVDGTTLSAADPGVTVSGEVISLEAGGKTLDIGTGHFVLPTQGAGDGSSVNVQAFTGGQGGKRVQMSSSAFVCIFCGIIVLLL